MQIRGAVARAVVVAEARTDVRVDLVRANRAFPLRISRFGEAVFVDGDVRHKSRSCRSRMGRPSVQIRGRGVLGYDDMPQLVIHAPLDVRVSAGEAVFGAIGRTRTLDFANQGCGDWLIGNVAGHLRLAEAGSGAVRAGSAASADLSVAGSGRVAVGRIAGRLTALSTGDGDIGADFVSGSLDARIAGGGAILVADGRVGDMAASVAGSGVVRFGGVAGDLRGQVTGPGLVAAARVTGLVTRRVFGPGVVRVGPPTASGRATPGR